MNTIKGKVYDVQTESGTGQKGEWKRTTVVVETSSKFNNLVPISFFNEDINVNNGDEVSVDFYVGGREYNGKYYAQLDGNKITANDQASQQQQPTQQKAQPQPKSLHEDDPDNPLPF